MPFLEIHCYALDGKLEDLKQEIEQEVARNNDKTIKDIIDLPTDNGDTPLLLAVGEGHVNVVEYLIAQNANLRVCGKLVSAPPLQQAILGAAYSIEEEKSAECFYTIIRMLLQKDISLLDATDRSSYNAYALINSLRETDPQMRNVILEIISNISSEHPLVRQEKLVQQMQLKIKDIGLKKIDFYARDFSIARLSIPQRELLQDLGAQYFDIIGEPPISYNGGNAYALFNVKEQLIIDYAKKWNPHIAAEKNHIEIMQILLDNKLDPNSVDNKGITLLTKAACSKHTKMVQLLLERGALATKVNKDGRTSLQYVVEESVHHEEIGEIVELLRTAEEKEKSIQDKTTVLNGTSADEVEDKLRRRLPRPSTAIKPGKIVSALIGQRTQEHEPLLPHKHAPSDDKPRDDEDKPGDRVCSLQ